MIKFITTKELYESQNIDKDYIDTFNKLDSKVQDIIKDKNIFLRRYLERKNIPKYDGIDFSKQILRLDKIIIWENTGQEDICPMCGKAIEKKNITVRVGRKTKGFLIHACESCKKLYSNNISESEALLSRAQVNYMLITNEEKEYGTDK